LCGKKTPTKQKPKNKPAKPHNFIDIFDQVIAQKLDYL